MFYKLLTAAAALTFVRGQRICPSNYDPVCCDGTVYSNGCVS